MLRLDLARVDALDVKFLVLLSFDDEKENDDVDDEEVEVVAGTGVELLDGAVAEVDDVSEIDETELEIYMELEVVAELEEAKDALLADCSICWLAFPILPLILPSLASIDSHEPD